MFTPKALPIIILGSNRAPFLERPCTSVPTFNKRFINYEIPSLTLTAIKNNCISFSSPLVGLKNRVLIVYRDLIQDQWDEYPEIRKDNFLVMINPKLIKFTAQKEVKEEECPVMPNFLFEVERSLGIVVRFMDFEGNILEKQFYGFDARVIQHEIGHLNGELISHMKVCKGKSREKYDLTEFKKINQYYENLAKTEIANLEVLYTKDKKFQMKTDSQRDKMEFFMRLALGNERFAEFQERAGLALRIDMAKGKLQKT